MAYQVFGKQRSSPPMVSDAGLAEMQQFRPFSAGWMTGLQYGLGCMQLKMTVPGTAGAEVLEFVGHGGEVGGLH